MRLEVRRVRSLRGAATLVAWVCLGAAGLAVASALSGATPPRAAGDLVRRNFLVIPPEGLELSASGVPEGASVTLLAELPAAARAPRRVELSLDWLDPLGKVLQRRTWERIFLPPRPGLSEYISLRGATPSRARVIRLRRQDFPLATATIRISARGEGGRVLARFQSRVRRLSAGPPAGAEAPAELEPGASWTWKPMAARRAGGGIPEFVELLRGEVVPPPPATQAPDVGWHVLGPGRALAFDLAPGSYSLETDPPGVPGDAQLLEVGARPRPLPLDGQAQVASPATIVFPATPTELRVRVEGSASAGVPLEPALVSAPTYLVGPPAEVARVSGQYSELGYRLQLPPRRDHGALQLRLRGLAPSGAPLPESCQISLRYHGPDGEELQPTRARLDLPPPGPERLPWAKVRSTGARTLTLAPPLAAETLRVELSVAGLVDAAWVAAPRRTRAVRSRSDPALCRLTTLRPATTWPLLPLARGRLEGEGRRVLLTRARGAVVPPREQDWRLRSLTRDAAGTWLLFPPVHEGTVQREVPSLGGARLRRLRAPAPFPRAILAPGTASPWRVLEPGATPPPRSYEQVVARPGGDRILRSARQATPARPLTLEAPLGQPAILVVHLAATQPGGHLDVDLAPLAGEARRPLSFGAATSLRRRFLLPTAGEGASRLEEGPNPAGPCARLVVPLGSDLSPGTWRVQLRPSAPLWISAALGTSGLLAPGRTRVFLTQGARRLEVESDAPVSSEVVLSDGVRELSSTGALDSGALALRLTPQGERPASVGVEAELQSGERVRLTPAGVRREVRDLPCELRFPHPKGGALRLWVHESEGAGPAQPLRLEWLGGRQPAEEWTPELRPRPGLSRAEDPQARALRQASRVFEVPAGAYGVRVRGSRDQQISAEWRRAAPPPTVIRDLAQGSLERLWREGVFARLELPPPTRWLISLPPELAPISSEVAAPLELVPLSLSGAEDRIDLWETILISPRPELDAPAPVWRPLRVGVETSLRVQDPAIPEARLGTLRVRYRGLEASRLPLQLRFLWRSQLEHEERLYVPSGEIYLRDLPAGPGVLRVEGPRLPSGSLWVRLSEPPAPGDRRIRSAWLAPEAGRVRFDLSQARSGDLLQLEVFTAPGAGWSRWEVELRGRRVRRAETHWCRAGTVPLGSEDGRAHVLAARISVRLGPADRELGEVSLQGPLSEGLPVRAVLIRERP